MQENRGLPAWLDINKMVGQHPMPLMGNFIKGRLNEVSKTVTAHVTTWKCPGCGLLEFFEK
jgi:hypothetical protein